MKHNCHPSTARQVFDPDDPGFPHFFGGATCDFYQGDTPWNCSLHEGSWHAAVMTCLFSRTRGIDLVLRTDQIDKS